MKQDQYRWSAVMITSTLVRGFQFRFLQFQQKKKIGLYKLSVRYFYSNFIPRIPIQIPRIPTPIPSIPILIPSIPTPFPAFLAFPAFPPLFPAFPPPFPAFPPRFPAFPPLFEAFPPQFPSCHSFYSLIPHSGFYR